MLNRNSPCSNKGSHSSPRRTSHSSAACITHRSIGHNAPLADHRELILSTTARLSSHATSATRLASRNALHNLSSTTAGGSDPSTGDSLTANQHHPGCLALSGAAGRIPTSLTQRHHTVLDICRSLAARYCLAKLLAIINWPWLSLGLVTEELQTTIFVPVHPGRIVPVVPSSTTEPALKTRHPRLARAHSKVPWFVRHPLWSAI